MRQIYDTDIGLDEYQLQALKTAVYPEQDNNYFYPLLGLVGETGELSEKLKKLWRDKGIKDNIRFNIANFDQEEIIKELGDILWYFAALSNELGFSLAQIAKVNIDKLKSRQNRNTLHGSGDNR